MAFQTAPLWDQTQIRCSGLFRGGGLEAEQASNLWGQVSRLEGWDKALSCPDGVTDSFLLD